MENGQDKDAIRDLHHLYAFYIDTFDVESWVNCFTADAVFDESEHGFGIHTGHEQIRTYGKVLKQNAELLVHIMANHIVSLTNENIATGQAVAITEVKYRSGEHVRIHCTYNDTYVKNEGSWKIHSRKVGKTFPPEPVPT